ncbi:3-hydroxyacyl-CoA dehydrogenase type-2 isoform X2 [Nematostella vectensis]|uniref:3-hydroxyacyl-CoA dehydrogenase type-2 isoform X2 n=1 Tax=Nematostella vectensis TaxID=45351 RepID=UPI00139042F5|nr:3-hydroxyacyl-CoA dehydrogenase type-2 isoform X2 [Nematostella vectensis]
MLLEKVVALIVGGASGIGRATAIRLIRAGARAVIVDLPSSEGQNTAQEFGSHCTFIPGHVDSESEIKAAIKVAKEKYGCVNASINTAALNTKELTLSESGCPHPLELFEETMKINAVGTFNVARLVAESMATNTPDQEGERGVIVNVSSIHGTEGQSGKVAYAATKGAINAMTLPMARDLAKLGIRVNTISPGRTKESREAITKSVPFPRRTGKPEEFAQLVQAVIENPMINGEIIRIDGALRF